MTNDIDRQHKGDVNTSIDPSRKKEFSERELTPPTKTEECHPFQIVLRRKEHKNGVTTHCPSLRPWRFHSSGSL